MRLEIADTTANAIYAKASQLGVSVDDLLLRWVQPIPAKQQHGILHALNALPPAPSGTPAFDPARFSRSDCYDESP